MILTQRQGLKTTAIIFDVDGVLLELLPEEEEIFFQPFTDLCGLNGLSRDWNSYKIRNEVEIIAEILTQHGLPAHLKSDLVAAYLENLNQQLAMGRLVSLPIPGAARLIAELHPRFQLGIATANIKASAMMRLKCAGLWPFPGNVVMTGADRGGHKSDILARTIAELGLAARRIIYIGDNINDVVAAKANNTHFIGFSADRDRRQKLQRAGALHIADTHHATLALVNKILTVSLP